MATDEMMDGPFRHRFVRSALAFVVSVMGGGTGIAVFAQQLPATAVPATTAPVLLSLMLIGAHKSAEIALCLTARQRKRRRLGVGAVYTLVLLILSALASAIPYSANLLQAGVAGIVYGVLLFVIVYGVLLFVPAINILAALSIARNQAWWARIATPTLTGMLGMLLLGGLEAWKNLVVTDIEYPGEQPLIQLTPLPKTLGLWLGIGLCFGLSISLFAIGGMRSTGKPLRREGILTGILLAACALLLVLGTISQFGVHTRTPANVPISRDTLRDLHLWLVLEGKDFVLHPNGEWIIVSGSDAIHIWDMLDGSQVRQISGFGEDTDSRSGDNLLFDGTCPGPGHR